MLKIVTMREASRPRTIVTSPVAQPPLVLAAYPEKVMFAYRRGCVTTQKKTISTGGHVPTRRGAMRVIALNTVLLVCFSITCV
jgi:hypothetical protein